LISYTILSVTSSFLLSLDCFLQRFAQVSLKSEHWRPFYYLLIASVNAGASMAAVAEMVLSTIS
jgi:hypothetical protein